MKRNGFLMPVTMTAIAVLFILIVVGLVALLIKRVTLEKK